MITLKRHEVLNFSADCYTSRFAIKTAIVDRYACGISNETADRILADYHAAHRA